MTIELAADCTRCAGLCCGVFAFEKSAEFAIDKPAGTACSHLDAGFRCDIHADRQALGYSGCLNFDCYGAGQVMTADILAGGDWRKDGDLRDIAVSLFAELMYLHKAAFLLDQCRHLPLDAAMTAQCSALKARARRPAAGWTEPALRNMDGRQFLKEVNAFLRSLEPLIGARNR